MGFFRFEGLYDGLFASLSISFVQKYAAGQIGRASALYWNALMVSGLIARPVVGLVAFHQSFQTVLYFACLGAVIALAVLALMQMTARASETRPPKRKTP
ncbi:hypothetical protein N6L24_09515 [Cognatishimia sp. SS12]|uniref:hypothetical protein n=1 Tax=Cognatishimia sp. SS12 TaxID=2979465 RepID=UPI00232DB984|nr:hypothetical protein [Cognatishimia sp. SS12]MDC0738517.1 hypothetical protein [Cognatishimia sp. SS12]